MRHFPIGMRVSRASLHSFCQRRSFAQRTGMGTRNHFTVAIPVFLQNESRTKRIRPKQFLRPHHGFLWGGRKHGVPCPSFQRCQTHIPGDSEKRQPRACQMAVSRDSGSSKPCAGSGRWRPGPAPTLIGRFGRCQLNQRLSRGCGRPFCLDRLANYFSVTTVTPVLPDT